MALVPRRPWTRSPARISNSSLAIVWLHCLFAPPVNEFERKKNYLGNFANQLWTWLALAEPNGKVSSEFVDFSAGRMFALVDVDQLVDVN